MINIVVPMAGRGSRFQKEGYTLPKPLIPVHGIPMIEVIVNNIKPAGECHFIFICYNEHEKKYNFKHFLKSLVPKCTVIVIDEITEGAACTVLKAKDYINEDTPLMIANSDQWVDVDINKYLEYMEKNNSDGLIMTMWANHPKWSYIMFNEKNDIIRVVEKEVVSNEATVGIYNFRFGKDFVFFAERMISNNIRSNGEFYVAPVYNEMIGKNKKIGYYNVGKEFDGMYGLGIPSDLNKFLENPISKKAIKGCKNRDRFLSA
jgi:NDP-sugar pyrophosphorylase family protein